MKIILQSLGVLIGVVIGFFLSNQLKPKAQTVIKQKANAQLADTTKWQWADSLDAVKAAPQNHHVIFENNKIRILEVILKPYEFENLHTHRLPSVMFGNNNSDISSFDIIYYRYGYDSSNQIFC